MNNSVAMLFLYVSVSAVGHSLYGIEKNTEEASVKGSVPLGTQISNQLCFTQLQGNVRSLVSSFDDMTFIAVCDDGTALVQDTYTGTVKSISQLATVAACSPCDTSALIGYTNGGVRLLDIQTGRCVHTLQGHTTAVTVAVFSPDGKSVLTASRDGTAFVSDVESGALLKTIKTDLQGITSMALSPLHALLVCADSKTYLWDTEKGQVLVNCGDSASPVYEASFGCFPYTTFVTNHFWTDFRGRKRSGSCLRRFQEGTLHSHYCSCAAFNPCTGDFVTGDYTGTLVIWENGLLRHHCDPFYSPSEDVLVTSLAYNRDATLLFVGLSDGTAYCRTEKTIVRYLRGHTDAIISAVFSSDGTCILTGSLDSTIRLWDTAGNCLLILDGPHDIIDVSFSAASNLIYATSATGKLSVWVRSTNPQTSSEQSAQAKEQEQYEDDQTRHSEIPLSHTEESGEAATLGEVTHLLQWWTSRERKTIFLVPTKHGLPLEKSNLSNYRHSITYAFYLYCMQVAQRATL